jgi:hypothetical protein
VVHFGRCRAVEGGGAKEACNDFAAEAEWKKGGAAGLTWVHHAEKKRRGGVWQRDVAMRGGGGSDAGNDTGVEEGRAARSCGSMGEGGWPVGWSAGWGPAGGGKGGYDRWAWAEKGKEKKVKKTDSIQI